MNKRQFTLIDIHKKLPIKATILSIGNDLDDMKKYQVRFKELNVDTIIIETTDWDKTIIDKCIQCTGYIYNVIKQLNLDKNKKTFVQPDFKTKLIMFNNKILMK